MTNMTEEVRMVLVTPPNPLISSLPFFGHLLGKRVNTSLIVYSLSVFLSM
jgi:hypothetical protein